MGLRSGFGKGSLMEMSSDLQKDFLMGMLKELLKAKKSAVLRGNLMDLMTEIGWDGRLGKMRDLRMGTHQDGSWETHQGEHLGTLMD